MNYPRSYAEAIFGDQKPSVWGLTVGEMDLSQITGGPIEVHYDDPRSTQEKFDHAGRLITELEDTAKEFEASGITDSYYAPVELDPEGMLLMLDDELAKLREKAMSSGRVDREPERA